MKPIRNTFPLLAIAVASLTTARAQDPLPSWNEGPAKKSIIEFVAKVSKEGTPDFVPPAERIATFDNDGTLWCEQPLYTQIFFALDRVKALAAECREPCSSPRGTSRDIPFLPGWTVDAYQPTFRKTCNN